MPIPIVCPSCGKTLKAPDTARGKKARCPQCASVIPIPVEPAPSGSPRPATAIQAKAAPLPTVTKSRPPALPKNHLAQQELLPPVPSRPQPLDVRVTHQLAPAPEYADAWPVASTEATKPCPFCAERILETAKKCKHCGEYLDFALRAAMEAKQQQAAPVHQPAPVQIINNVGVVHREKQWDAGIACLLSLLLPGMGQLYKGQAINGMVWFFVVILGYAFLIIPGLVLHLLCILGAGLGDPYRRGG